MRPVRLRMRPIVKKAVPQRLRANLILRGWLLLVALWLAAPAALAARVKPAPVYVPTDYRPANYAVREAFPGLPSLRPVVITSAPGDTNRIFFADQTGVIYVMTNRAAPSLAVFLDLRDRVWAFSSEAGLLGLAFHPGWQTNRQFFVFYTTYRQTLEGGQTNYTFCDRLARFWMDPTNSDLALPGSEQPLITQPDEDSSHNAGDLHFGPDGNLYVSLGDEGGSYDSYGNTHHLDGDFFSAILRLDVDQRPGSLPPNPHPAVNPGTYAVPADNPFVGATGYAVGGTNVIWPSLNPAQVRTEFFAIGFRNPWRFGIDSSTGEVYANDVGQELREEINHIVPGGDYGWVWREGFLDWPFWVPASGLTDPITDYPHTNTLRAITGGLLYRGTAYPELDGLWVFADVNGAIGSILPTAQSSNIKWLAFEPGISALGTDPVTGEILIANVFSGKINRLVRVGEPVITAVGEWPSPPPPKLSQTAIFKDLATLTPADGFTPYEVNSTFWSDYALKRRWFRLPSATAAFGFRTNGAWDSPMGTVWVKHFDLPTNRQDTATARRLETRLITRTKYGVYGVTYRWDPDGRDARLVPPDGATEAIPVFDSGVIKTQIWRYPGHFECLLCHNSSAGYSLGFRTDQLNCLTTGLTGTTNQLQQLIATGCVAGAPAAINVLPRLAPVTDERWSRDWRVRSYLSANCTQCHTPTGPTWANWDARWQTPLENARMVWSFAALQLDGEGDTFVVHPGDVSKSALFDRLTNSAESLHMPPLATSEINQAALGLVGAWITNDVPARLDYASWATNYFADAASAMAAPEADPDGDGLSNQAEFLLRQSPLDPTVVWRPQLIADPAGTLRLRFRRLANRLFTVETMTNVVTRNWQPLDIPENAPFYAATDEWAELPLPAGAATGFFRVTIAGPP
ncbi:MAG TPA: PQQ-dependent sugar dehydrogenase [Candidatus Limnocylindria bacterium]|nr:PQQ-dependent sugar dehydrogenase [Candidatus Limnocylindria bacterium]